MVAWADKTVVQLAKQLHFTDDVDKIELIEQLIISKNTTQDYKDLSRSIVNQIAKIENKQQMGNKDDRITTDTTTIEGG